jgi:plastocyanin
MGGIMFERNRSIRLLATTLVLALAACGGGGDATTDQADAPSADADAPAAVAVTDPGTINGVINFTGTAPANAPIDMSEEPACAEKHTGGVTQQTVIANDGRLKNVFVYVKEGLTGTHAPASEPVRIDQDGCVYTPHVLGVQAGQNIVIHNSDDLLHNVKAQPTVNRPFNLSQPSAGIEHTRTFDEAEVMVPIQCDVHGWMQAYVGVVDHPYFAVSGDDGTFTIGNLPAGTYTIETWHEQYGTQTQQVTVAANGTADVTFDYNASQAGAYVPLGEPVDPHGSHGTRVASARR